MSLPASSGVPSFVRMSPLSRRIAAIVTAGALVAPLAGCGQFVGSGYVPPPEPAAAGSFQGAGASAQSKAMETWIAGYTSQHNPDVTVSYDPVGSGEGRKRFLAGEVAYAGSDSVLTEQELEASTEACGGGNAIDLPVYISPISVAFNLGEIEQVNLRPGVIARIFAGEITTWNDPEITVDNPDIDLPDLAITPVHRSDDSGTTENFTDYLAQVAPSEWPHEPDGVWPLSGGRAEEGTGGVTEFVARHEGAITYADASATQGLGSVAVRVGGEFVSYTPEAAAAMVDVSPLVEGRKKYDLAYEIDRRTTGSSVYPLVLVSYLIVCSRYTDKPTGRFVKEFVEYVASDEGQEAAARAAGSAQVSGFVQRRLEEAANAIYLG